MGLGLGQGWSSRIPSAPRRIRIRTIVTTRRRLQELEGGVCKWVWHWLQCRSCKYEESQNCLNLTPFMNIYEIKQLLIKKDLFFEIFFYFHHFSSHLSFDLFLYYLNFMSPPFLCYFLLSFLELLSLLCFHLFVFLYHVLNKTKTFEIFLSCKFYGFN